MKFEQYYRTPTEVAEKVADFIQKPVKVILEPSAGTGELAEGFIKAKGYPFSEEDFHCVEFDKNRSATLKGKGFRVIWDDFETFQPLMPYQTIIMNPPFHNGAKHLLKALNILADGGEIACILNAETIKNPFSKERRELVRQLEEQEEYKVEYVESAFEDSDVEIAIVYAKKKEASAKCITFENYKKSEIEERQATGDLSMTRYGEVKALIDNYRAEVKTALKLYEEVQNYNKVAIHGEYNEVFEIRIKHGYCSGRAGIVKAINSNYWHRLLFSEELDRLLTSETRGVYSSKLNEMADYEFNERNILQLKEDLCRSLYSNIDRAIMKVWDSFTSRFSWSEYSKNIHYYNGWKTNKAFKCNKRIILPLNAFSGWQKTFELYRANVVLSDIEKAMNYLDSGRTESADMANKLQVAKDCGRNTNIDTKYFTVNLYKKGTAHLTFKDLELLKKFNLYCGKKLKWLPEDYGKKAYTNLTDEEREVADSFEGRESYEETFKKQQFYLTENAASTMLMLTAG